MKAKLLFLTAILGTLTITAQPEISWQNNYGSILGDVAYSVDQTIDGGYVFAGYVLSHNGDVSNHNGQRDFWIVKTNSQGTIEWEKTYGGSSYEIAYSIQQTSDNGYIVAGLTASDDGDITEYFGNEDIWVIKLDGSGNLEWQKSYGDEDNEKVLEIVQTTDGGYIMAGNSWINTSHSDFVVKKIAANGDLEWQNIFGYDNNGSEDYARSIKQTSDGGYIVAGRTLVLEQQLNTSDYWVVKLNSLGNIDWDTRLGGSNIDEAWDAQQTIDGGYIVTGHTFSNDGDVTGNHGMEDIWVVKLNSTGNIQWQKALGGSGHESSTSVIQSNDGNYLIVGYTDSNDGDVSGNQGSYDGWVVKLDINGAIIWQSTHGGSDLDYFRKIKQTADGGYIVSGAINSGDTDSGPLNGGTDYWVVKFGAETLGVNTTENELQSIVYPNPATDKININTNSEVLNVEVYNILGKQIFASEAINQIDVGEFSKGLYLLKIKTEKGVVSKKIIIN